MAHRMVGHLRGIHRAVRYRIGEICAPRSPAAVVRPQQHRSPIRPLLRIALLCQAAQGFFLALGRHSFGGSAVAWFIEQSALMIVLAFLLGLLVGWLYWGRLARALRRENSELRNQSAERPSA